MKNSSYNSKSISTWLRKKIICVDDIAYSLVSIKSRLHKHYEIYSAESTGKMYEFLEKFIPDLILLDVNMPGIDGYEAIKKLKADERYANIPVIFLTGNSDRESVIKGLSLGAIDYVIKPFNTSKLIESIENHLSPKRLKKASQSEGNSHEPCILVVDDVTSMLRSIQHALRGSCKVYILSKSEDVMDFLRIKKLDLIMLDLLMPVLNGFDLIPLIRALPEHKDTPIIILTTEGTTDHVNEAMALGATDFIVKPFKPKELNDKVMRHIRIITELKRKKVDN